MPYLSSGHVANANQQSPMWRLLHHTLSPRRPRVAGKCVMHHIVTCMLQTLSKGSQPRQQQGRLNVNSTFKLVDLLLCCDVLPGLLLPTRAQHAGGHGARAD